MWRLFYDGHCIWEGNQDFQKAWAKRDLKGFASAMFKKAYYESKITVIPDSPRTNYFNIAIMSPEEKVTEFTAILEWKPDFSIKDVIK
jgi:hypothetical protein